MGTPWTNSQRVRAYLKKHDVRCPGCTYSLRGLETATCPECGRRLLIKDLLPPNPYARQWRVFRGTLYLIWFASTGLVVYFLAFTYPTWLTHPRGGRVTVAPLLIGVVMFSLLIRARAAYDGNSWPQFIRSTLRTTGIVIAVACALAVLLWVLLNLIYP